MLGPLMHSLIPKAPRFVTLYFLNQDISALNAVKIIPALFVDSFVHSKLSLGSITAQG